MIFDRRLQHMLTKSRLASVNVCLTYVDVDMVLHLDFIVMSMLLPGAGRAVGTRCAPTARVRSKDIDRDEKSHTCDVKPVHDEVTSASGQICPGELTSKGGWAGVKVATASEVPERARRAPATSRRIQRKNGGEKPGDGQGFATRPRGDKVVPVRV